MNKLFIVILLAISCLLGGCGAGGHDYASEDPSALTESTNTFDLSTAWKRLIQTGYGQTFYLYLGTCEGTIHIEQSGDPSLQLTQTITQESFNNCNDGVYRPLKTRNTTTYYDAEGRNNYFETTDDEFAWWSSPSDFPSAVKVSDNGLIGQVDIYKTSSFVYDRSEVWRYDILPHTASTALFVLKIATYTFDTSAQSWAWQATEEQSFVISATNTLTPIMISRHNVSGFEISARIH
jgi:hypothetical protein